MVSQQGYLSSLEEEGDEEHEGEDEMEGAVPRHRDPYGPRDVAWQDKPLGPVDELAHRPSFHSALS